MMKPDEEIMEILEAFDAMGSCCAATEPAGSSYMALAMIPSSTGSRRSCSVLGWFSRLHVVIALRDKRVGTVFAALDRTFRLIGGAPTYVLTDNGKTVTTAHIARVPVRNAQTVPFAVHYGVTMLTCQPADPASKDPLN